MGMLDFNLGEVGGVFTSVREAITGEKIVDKQKLVEEVNKLEATLIDAKSSVLTAEANSEHWLTASWRPLAMLVFVFIIANNYIIVPYLAVLGVTVPSLLIPEGMWGLLTMGLSGYVMGRSIEKSVKAYKGVI